MYLDRIVITKQKEVEALTAQISMKEVERQLLELDVTRGFHRALTEGRKRNLGLIAEVKKASPSKGLIRPDFHPVELAKKYEAAGTDCISVLTDREYFQGSPEYLTEIRKEVSVPLLRKDFIIDELQIYEARLIGADAVLLIAAILTDEQLKRYIQVSESLGLDVLLEVHDEAEMQRALNLGTARLIGINNRNLHTFDTSLETTEKLSAMVPDDVTLISESGIQSVEDVRYLSQVGAKGLLIGETFMRKVKVDQAVHELLGPVTRL